MKQTVEIDVHEKDMDLFNLYTKFIKLYFNEHRKILNRQDREFKKACRFYPISKIDADFESGKSGRKK